MDTTRLRERDDLPVLDMVAELEFKSASSACFALGTKGTTCFVSHGWLDIHHPCEGHIKVKVRVCLPERYHQPEHMRELVRQVFDHLAIAQDETYEADFVAASRQTGIQQATDRDGLSDRIY